MVEGSSRPWRLYLLLVFVMFIWSTNFIATKMALREVPGLLLSGFRILWAAIFLIPVYLWAVRKSGRTWTNSDGFKMAMLGIVGIGLNQMFFILGLARTTVSHAAFIFGTVPLAVLLMSRYFGIETISARKVWGILLALSGVAVLQARNAASVGPSIAGDLFILGSALTFACYIVFGKSNVQRFGPIIPTTIAFFAGAIALLPMTIYLGHDFDFTKVTAYGWGGMLYMAIGSSVIASLLYYYVLGHLPASRVSSFSYLQPLMASTLGITLLGEHLTTSLVSGGVLILGGVYLTERN